MEVFTDIEEVGYSKIGSTLEGIYPSAMVLEIQVFREVRSSVICAWWTLKTTLDETNTIMEIIQLVLTEYPLNVKHFIFTRSLPYRYLCVPLTDKEIEALK